MKKIIFLISQIAQLLFLFSITGCAFSQDRTGSSSQTKKMAEDNAQIAANFSRITGTYSGKLKTINGDQTIQIYLATLAVSDGTKNSDGSDRIHVTLSSTYIKIDPVGRPLVNFSISYTPETGDLTLINLDVQNKNNLDEVNTVFARITGDHMTGTVKSATHDLGMIDLKLTSNNSSSTSSGALNEYNQRLRKQYSELAGAYVGCVVPTDGGSLQKPYTAKMTLSLYEDSSDSNNPLPLPTLAGNFHRDTDKTDGTDTALSTIYKPELNPNSITILGKPYITNNGYISTFAGNILNGEFSGSFTSNKKGLEGQIYLKKGNTYPRQCDIARLRMDTEY